MIPERSASPLAQSSPRYSLPPTHMIDAKGGQGDSGKKDTQKSPQDRSGCLGVAICEVFGGVSEVVVGQIYFTRTIARSL